nr:hypothetical protein [Tanacetum cinerariifolium]
KGFPGVEIPLFEGMLVAGVIKEEGDAEEQVQDVAAQRADTTPQPQSQPQAQQQAADFPMSLLREALDACVVVTRRVEHLEYDKVAQALKIIKLKRRVKKLEKANRVKGRIIDALDSDAGVALMDDKKEEKKAKKAKKDEPAKVQEVVDVVTTDKLITEVVTAAIRVAAASTRRRKGMVIRDPEEESTTIIPADTKSKNKGKGIMVEEPKPLKKKQQVEMDEEYARKLHEELNKYIDWNVAIDHVKQKAKEDPFVQRYQTKERLEDEENRAIQSINATLAQKAAKRRKLNEEVKDLKRYLEIVPDEDDDMYTEATSLARKSLVKERFSTSKPNNFSDDFLLTTLGAMFERPDGQAQVWKNQRTTYGQAKVKRWKLLESCGVHIITFITTQLILLVERRYPLSRFTLAQMLNAVRLRVEAQSEMSLELLRFIRQQH